MDPGIAVLIVAHANPVTFSRLVQSLDHPRIQLFCHVDSRVDQQQFASRVGGRVTFTPNRRKNYWGAFTQVETALDLFAMAREAGPFRSYLLVSGDSLPVVSNERLLQLTENWPTIVRFREQFPGDHSYKRVANVYLPTTQIGGFRVGTHLERYLSPSDLEIMPRAMKARELKKKIDFRVWKGSQWICISDEHLRLVQEFVSASPDFMELFRFSAIPDELFFQTILKMIDPSIPNSPGLMAQDWNRKPKPFTLRSPDDIELISNSKRPFFRKFCDAGLELVDLVLAGRERSDGASRQLWKGYSFHYAQAPALEVADVEEWVEMAQP